jgi:glycosyltransferase involved in cell wall biosynthesis
MMKDVRDAAGLDSYSVVTAARNEAANLPRLAQSLRAQDVLPREWVIVDDGSDDETPQCIAQLAAELPWVRMLRRVGASTPTRGAPVAAALQSGFAALSERVDVVAVVDADVSFDPRFFHRVLTAFADEASLGIVSGARQELRAGAWRRHFVTAPNVEAQCRAYRTDCLAAVLPYEPHKGWDAVDVVRAVLGGWTTRVVAGAVFRHHRPVGARDAGALAKWRVEGRAAHYLGYRHSYVLLRSLFHTRTDAAAMFLWVGYAGRALSRAPRCSDRDVLAEVRRRQRLRELPQRLREVRGT